MLASTKMILKLKAGEGFVRDPSNVNDVPLY